MGINMSNKAFLLVLTILLMLSSCYQEPKQARRCSSFNSRNFAVKPIMPNNSKYMGIDEKYKGYQKTPQLRPVNPGSNQAGEMFSGNADNVDIRAYNADGAPVANLAAISFKGSNGQLYPVKEMVYGGLNRALEDINDYRFGKNDQMSLRVDGHDEFSGKIQILTDGSVELPLLKKRIPALNLTREELKESIKKEIEPYLLTDPKIQLGIDFAAGQYYYIFGEVDTPGRWPMGISPITVSEAVFRANSSSYLERKTSGNTKTAVSVETREKIGVEERIKAELDTSPRFDFEVDKAADLRKVYIITPHRSRPTREIVNVKEILVEGKTGNDKIIKPGQIIFVPSAIDERFMRFTERLLAPINSAKQIEDQADYIYGRFKR